MTSLSARLVTAAILFSSVAAAQSVLIRVFQGNTLTPVANGGVYTVNAAGVGQSQPFTVEVTYLGPTRLTFSGSPQLIGSTDFKITKPPTTSVLLPNQTMSFDAVYTPSDAAGAGAEVDLPATESSADSITVPRILVLLLKGTAPDFLLTYKFDFDANTRSVPPGGELSFIDTSINAPTTATVTMVNRGSGTGQIVSVTSSGDAFSLASVPILPLFVPSNGTLPFQVRFRPRDLKTHTGALAVALEGSQYAVTLKGQGISSYLSYEVASPGVPASAVVPNSVIALPDAALGQTSTVSVALKNTSAFDISVNSIAVSGAGFELKNVPFLPFTLAPGEGQAFSVAFTPTTVGQSRGRLNVGGDTFELAGAGLLPQMNYSVQAAGASSTPVAPGGVISFPPTTPGAASTLSININNTTKFDATITSIVLSGTAFQFNDAPILPVTVPAGGAQTLSLTFSPATAGDFKGRLRIGNDSFDLAGSGVAARLTYSVEAGGTSTPVQPNGVISFPAAPIGTSSTVSVKITNSTKYDAALSSILLSGTGYQFKNAPILPATIPPGGVLSLTLSLTPSSADEFKGQLRVGSDTFDLVGTGVSPQLTYTFEPSGGSAAPVAPNGTILVPATLVGADSTVQLTVANPTEFDAVLSLLAISGSGYQLKDVPFLPAKIPAGGTQTFSVVFTPPAIGETKGRLQVGADSFDLSGSGAALPEYTIDGPTSVQALDQPSVGLTLAAAQTVDVKGTLTLNSEPTSYASDPAVVFISGARTATFTIPAGSTKAVFSNGSTSLKFQVGTVAGNIVVTPTFSTESGADVTPDHPITLRMTLSADVPKLFTAGIASRSASGFTLQVTGLTTTRNMTTLKVTFKARPGYNLAGAEFTQDLTGASLAWFSSQASAAFGGQFVLQLPFSLNSTDASATALINALESATVAISNEKGASNPIAVPF